MKSRRRSMFVDEPDEASDFSPEVLRFVTSADAPAGELARIAHRFMVAAATPDGRELLPERAAEPGVTAYETARCEQGQAVLSRLVTGMATERRRLPARGAGLPMAPGHHAERHLRPFDRSQRARDVTARPRPGPPRPRRVMGETGWR